MQSVRSGFETRKRKHDLFQLYVVPVLKQYGFLVDDRTYHNVGNSALRDRLPSMVNPTALFLRGKADFAAVHNERDIAFNIEIKTTKDAAQTKLEAVHFLTHYVLWHHRRVECIYVVWDRTSQRQYGFWVHEHPKIDRLVIPQRWHRDWAVYYEAMFSRAFPNVKCCYLDGNPQDGSGTPYVVMDCSQCNHWVHLVEERIYREVRA